MKCVLVRSDFIGVLTRSALEHGKIALRLTEHVCLLPCWHFWIIIDILFFCVCIAIHFIADDKGAFVTSLGLIFDASPLLGNPRSKASLNLIFSLVKNINLFLALCHHHRWQQSRLRRCGGCPAQRRSYERKVRSRINLKSFKNKIHVYTVYHIAF